MSYLSALGILVGLVSGLVSIYEFVKYRPNSAARGRAVTFAIVAVVLLIVAFILANIAGSKQPPAINLSLFLVPAIIIAIILTVTTVIVILYRRHLRKVQPSRTITYSEKISELTESLTNASAEVDRILKEMAQIVRERELAISSLEQREKDLQSKIDSLEKVPVEAAEFFTKYLESHDKKSSRRDLILFALGAFLSIVSISLGVLGLHLLGH